MEMKFYKCSHCGNIITFLEDKGVPVICCGEKMMELTANTSDGATEKHVPVYSIDGTIVNVSIGSAAHPMLAEHYIQWVVLLTKQGSQVKYLSPGSEPKVTFSITEDDEVEAVYEYCNLHGLWLAK